MIKIHQVATYFGKLRQLFQKLLKSLGTGSAMYHFSVKFHPFKVELCWGGNMVAVLPMKMSLFVFSICTMRVNNPGNELVRIAVRVRERHYDLVESSFISIF